MSYLTLVLANLRDKSARSLLTVLALMIAFLLFGLLRPIGTVFSEGPSLNDIGRLVVTPKHSTSDMLPLQHASRIAALEQVSVTSHTRHGQADTQVIDVALYESMFNLMEGMVPEYSGAGAIREPSGSTLTGIVPTNTYLCGDGKHVVIGANGDSIFVRLMDAIGKPDLARDERYADNAGRVTHQEFIDGTIATWTRAHTADEVIATLEAAQVPVGPIYNVADMMSDPHYIARGLFESVTTPQGELQIPAIMPKLKVHGGRTDWAGGEVGTHTDTILNALGYTDAQLTSLKENGAI